MASEDATDLSGCKNEKRSAILAANLAASLLTDATTPSMICGSAWAASKHHTASVHTLCLAVVMPL